MISVVIETRNDEDALARTLASLVGAAVEGVVRDVVVCDRGSTDQTARVADHAGCVFLENADIVSGIRHARGDWLMLLEPGARLDGHWMEAVRHHVAHAAIPVRFTRTGEGRRLLSRFFSAKRPLADGLVISKRQASARARPGGDSESIARGVSTKRLPVGIHAAPRR